MDPPVEYDTVEISALTSLPLVADVTDTSAVELAALNPALLGSLAPPHYALHVPKGSSARLTAALALVPPEHRAAWRLHRVAAGETLAAIGGRFGVSPATLLAANALPAHAAVEGDLLVVPAAPRALAPVRHAAPTHAVAGRTGSHAASHSASAAASRRPPARHVVAATRHSGAAPAARKPAGQASAARKSAAKPATLVAHSAAR
jgi:membrane-bound lytic murein transglycosylase D